MKWISPSIPPKVVEILPIGFGPSKPATADKRTIISYCSRNIVRTLKQEMKSDNDHATMRKSFLLVSLVGKCG